MAYTYFGNPFSIDENYENLNINGSDNIFKYYKKEEKNCILKMIDVIRENIIKNISNIDVGFTFTHSICKMKCDTCHNFPEQDVHLWKLLRIKLNSTKVVYIDLQNERTYKDWKDYLDNNTLPKGYMFFPISGYYEEATYLSSRITPCSKDSVLNNIDLVGKSATFASSIMLTGALIFPILSPVLVPSAVSIGTCSVWEMGRKITKLVDLNQHNQELFSRNAAEHWLDLTLATFGLITAPLSASIRMLELNNSAILTSKIGKSLMIAQKGTCITYCAVGIISLIESTRIKNNTLKSVMALRLDIFIVVGKLLPIILIQEIIEVSGQKYIMCTYYSLISVIYTN